MSKFTLTLQRCELVSWDTPLSDADWIGCATIKNEDSLWISFHVRQSKNQFLWVAQFTNVTDFRVTHGDNTEFRREHGWTACHRSAAVAEGSDEVQKFLDHLKMSIEPGGSVTQSDCCGKQKHFRMLTDDQCIDVFTKNEPQFRMIGSKAETRAAS